MKKIAKLSFILILSYMIVCTLVHAEDLQRSEEIGPQAQRFTSEVEREKEQVEKKPIKKPEIEVKEEKEKPTPAGPSFILKDIKVTGATLFKPEDFRHIYESHIGKEVRFSDLEAIAEKIKAKYKAKGYITTIVYIPEQEIKEGVPVEIRVVEGRLGEVKVQGNKWFKTRLIEKYFHTKKNEVLNVWKLQRDLLRLNQNSDLEVKTVIAAGKEPGTSDITLKVKERFPYHIGTSVDSLGSRLVGKYRNGISGRSTNLTGHMDSLFVNWLMSKSSSGTAANYAIPLDTYGTKLAFDAAIFTMQLGEEYESLNITGLTQVYTPHISGEIYLSDDLQVGVDTGIEMKSIRKKTNDVTTTYDELRLPYVTFDFSKLDSLWGGGQTTFSPKISFGTNEFLGASSRGHPSGSRQASGGSFVKYEHTLQRIQRMPLESYISTKMQLQFASRTLPSSEQMQLGGMYSVRGYPEGDYIADNGVIVSTDWVFPMYLIPKEWKLPYAEAPLRRQIQPVVFIDMGGGNIQKGSDAERKEKFLMGVGAGLKFQFNRNLFFRAEWAQRTGDRPAQSQGPSNFYMTFQFEL